ESFHTNIKRAALHERARFVYGRADRKIGRRSRDEKRSVGVPEAERRNRARDEPGRDNSVGKRRQHRTERRISKFVRGESETRLQHQRGYFGASRPAACGCGRENGKAYSPGTF